jgi:hypothetical protein
MSCFYCTNEFFGVLTLLTMIGIALGLSAWLQIQYKIRPKIEDKD